MEKLKPSRPKAGIRTCASLVPESRLAFILCLIIYNIPMKSSWKYITPKNKVTTIAPRSIYLYLGSPFVPLLRKSPRPVLNFVLLICFLFITRFLFMSVSLNTVFLSFACFVFSPYGNCELMPV